MVTSNAASGYVAKISMLILATYPSANSPSWPPCPGTFGTLFGTFGTFGTSGTFGTFLDPGNTVRVQHKAMLWFCKECSPGLFLTASPYYSEYSYSITASPQNASVEIPEWSFSPQKSPCGNSTKQHRACQTPGWLFSLNGNSTKQHKACQIPE